MEQLEMNKTQDATKGKPAAWSIIRGGEVIGHLTQAQGGPWRALGRCGQDLGEYHDKPGKKALGGMLQAILAVEADANVVPPEAIPIAQPGLLQLDAINYRKGLIGFALFLWWLTVLFFKIVAVVSMLGGAFVGGWGLAGLDKLTTVKAPKSAF